MVKPLAGWGRERRRSSRIGVTGSIRLPDEAITGFLLDASDTGVRAVLWSHDLRPESVVDLVLSVRGRAHTRRAIVRWARHYREGSVVGLEISPTDIPGSVTSIEPHRLVLVGDPVTTGR